MNNELLKCLDRAFYHLSRIAVAGDAVDSMALARQELRSAYALVKKEDEKTEPAK